MKKIVIFISVILLSFTCMKTDAYAANGFSLTDKTVYASDTDGVTEQNEAADSQSNLAENDPVELDTSGEVALTIEDKGDFHPAVRDSIEMIVAILLLIAVIGLILHFFDPADNKDKEGKDEKDGKKGKAVVRIIGYALVLAIMFLFFRYVIANVRIPSASMESTLMVGDRCAVNRMSYIGASPERGDIVIFKNEAEFGDEVIIKRVIGMPGDHISFKDGRVYINGGLVYEEYLDPDMETYSDCYYDVPEGCYFLMGDNRSNSADSRYWQNPYLSEDQIIGKHILTVHTGAKNK